MGINKIIKISQAGLIAATLVAMLAGGASAQTALRFTLESKFEGPIAPFLVGIDRGYYNGEKLSVIVDGAADSLESITRVASGLYDMGFADINLLIKYRDQNPNMPVMAVFMVYNKPTYAIISRKSRGVAKPKDLEGKKLGAPAADVSFSHWKLFAQVNSIDVTKVSVENVGFPVREPLLQSGQVDAITGHSNMVVPNLKAMGLHGDEIVTLLMGDYGVKLYGNAIIVNPKFAGEKPEAVKAFLQAYVKALREAMRSPVAAVESVLRRNDTLAKDVELERLRLTLKDNVVTPEVKNIGLGAIYPARMDQAIEQIGLTSEVKTKFKAADIFNGAYLPTVTLRRVLH